jgi:hypothetical protein
VAVGGFIKLADETNTGVGTGINLLSQDVLFTDTPIDITRTIQIQIQTSASAVILMTLDGGNTPFVPINNNNTIFGFATFTILVTKDTELNFEQDSGGTINYRIIVGG